MTLFQLNASSGIPVYLQLIEQVRHAVETGSLQTGDQLPTIRGLAQELVINPNTVVRAYRELERDGVVELRHGSGVFISPSVAAKSKLMRQAQAIMADALERMNSLGITEREIRRLFESELLELRSETLTGEPK